MQDSQANMKQLKALFNLQVSDKMRDEMYDQIKQYNIGLTKRLNEFKAA